MSTITRERIEQLANGNNICKVTREERIELASIALASLEAEPVAYMYKDRLHTDARFSLHTRLGNWSQEDINEYEITEIPLYTAQPAPVSDSLLSELLGIAKRAADEADECAHAEFSDDSMKHSAAIVDWERRAAMLQGVEPVTTANKLPFEQWLSQQTGTIDVECGCVMTEVFFHWLRVAYEAGNSPVIPDGWVLVPIEPTYQMCEAMCLQWESPRFPDRYKAMLAAVKK